MFHSLVIEEKLFELKSPKIMGILNITPDSFYDGGKYKTLYQIETRVEKMILEGVDIIDIGGQSTRPKAKIISLEEEKERIIPVLKRLKKLFPTMLFSIDTFRSEIAKCAIDYGAVMVNDISGGTMDKKMFKTIAELNVPYILTHIKGTLENMQDDPFYNDDIICEIASFFASQLQDLNALGVSDIIIDPGLGFGKTIDDNYEILQKLVHLHNLDCPIMIGVSRKSMIYRLLNTNVDDALIGTSAIHIDALNKGVNMLRTHDIKAAKQTIEIWKKLFPIKNNEPLNQINYGIS